MALPKIKRIATSAGAQHYGAPIGTPIKAAKAIKAARSAGSKAPTSDGSRPSAPKPDAPDAPKPDAAAKRRAKIKAPTKPAAPKSGTPAERDTALRDIKAGFEDLAAAAAKFQAGGDDAPSKADVQAKLEKVAKLVADGTARGWEDDIDAMVGKGPKAGDPSIPTMNLPDLSPPKAEAPEGDAPAAPKARKLKPPAAKPVEQPKPTPKPAEQPKPAAPAAEGPADKIRAAYDKLSTGRAVWLSDLRKETGLGEDEFDAAVTLLSRERGVEVLPEENRKAIPQHARDGAVTIGGQPAHHIRFRDEQPRQSTPAVVERQRPAYTG